MPEERRHHPRIYDPIAALVPRLLRGAHFDQAQIVDMSAMGAAIRTRVDLPIGTEFFAGIFVSGYTRPPLVVRCKVVRTGDTEDGKLIGVEFTGGGPAQEESLRELRDHLASRAPGAAPTP